MGVPNEIGSGLRLTPTERKYLQNLFLKTRLRKPYYILSDIITVALFPLSLALAFSFIYPERKRLRKEQQRVRFWDI